MCRRLDWALFGLPAIGIGLEGAGFGRRGAGYTRRFAERAGIPDIGTTAMAALIGRGDAGVEKIQERYLRQILTKPGAKSSSLRAIQSSTAAGLNQPPVSISSG